LLKHNQYIQHVGNVCGAKVGDFQEGPSPGNGESEKKAKCCSGKVMTITD